MNLPFYQALREILISVVCGLCFMKLCPVGTSKQSSVQDSFVKAGNELASTISRQLETFPSRELHGLTHYVNKVSVASQIFIFYVE